MRRRRGLLPIAVELALLWPRVAAAAPAGEIAALGVRLEPIEIRLLEHDRSLPVTYADALRIAAAKHFDILRARARLEEARARRLSAGGELLPSLSADLAVRHTDGEVQDNFGGTGRTDFSTILPAGRLALELNPGQAIFDLLAAVRREEAGEYEAEGATQATLARVAAQYFLLLRSQAEVNIAVAAVTTARELARLARDRKDLGAGLTVDVARAEARLAREEVALTAAEERFRGASIDLAESLRLEPGIVLLPTEREVRQEQLANPERPLDELLGEALAHQPELRARHLESQAGERERTASWWKAVGPEVYGAVEESAIGRSFDVNNRTIYGGFIGWTLAASSFADTRIAAARAEQAVLVRDQVEQAVQAEVARARDAVLTARERMAAARRGVSAAEQSLALSEDRIKGGVGLQLEAIEAQEALVTARTALVDSIVGYNVSQVRLLRALGGISLAALGAAE